MAYNRINLDGISKTEAYTSDADTLPGSVLVLASGKFVAAADTDAGKQLYVANAGHLQGLGTADAIPAGDTIEGEYADPNRRLAVLVKAGAVLEKDTPLALDADGVLDVATPSGDPEAMPVIVAYSQEDRTVGASAELVFVQVK